MAMAKRMVFMGSDVLSLPVMRYLRSVPGLEFAGVFTQPDRPAGRGQKVQMNPIKLWALEEGLPVLQPERFIGEAQLQWIKDQAVDIAFVMAFGQLLKQAVLDVFPLGAWNFHPSLLPLYRGPCPLEAALLQGDKATGVTLMQMILKMDAGAIVDVEPMTIDVQETTESLRIKAAEACVPLMQRQLGALLAGEAKLTPQDEAGVCYVRKLEKDDGALDFKKTAEALERQVRALSNWPGAFFELGGLRLKVGQATCGGLEAFDGLHGEVLAVGPEGVGLLTAEGVLRIQALQKPGGRMLPVSDFLRGFPIEVGQVAIGSEGRLPIVTKEHQRMVVKPKPSAS